MDWALENADLLARDDESSFAFVHIMAPHPPFLFDRHCDTIVEPSRFGVTFNRTGVPESVRAGHLQESLVCLNSFMADLKSRIGDEAVVVFASDHGTDRRDQLVADPEDWSSAARLERMNALLAVSSSACDVGDPVVLANVMRRALSCFTTDGIAGVDTRMFIGPDFELPAESVAAIVGGS